MTQKELLYVEDAIGHEDAIIAICNDIVSKLEDHTLVNFMNIEIGKHNEMKKYLLDLLEGEINE